MLYPGLFDVQLIVFSQNRGTSFNWSPPKIDVIPIDEKSVPLACFDLKAMSRMPDYKRKPIGDSLRVLNEKEYLKGCQWVVAGLECCDDAVCLVVKLV
ncbi:hypothetical protein AOL_s00091g72 [Orbilia oligospora ATCC 24927]|uniref:Uncharacterized protein n=1 Tax=Arthrobotrys oligospora (strain ATCC 24927 / CBS 115.81 / DSM 1491) TaxID=756982 RepID=G1XI20_ARTOA|nr:hypothetical protein AOL_s00091g72 [Orbilia oligospora ATCC 24927]EGX47251.1 hypothetical protein AOL_s00091g72 [Orbilia oligospora ATCC 24927]